MKKLFSEVIKIKDGLIYNIDYHQHRVDATQDAFRRSSINLSKVLADLLSSVPHGLFKCRLVYGNEIESVELIPYTYPLIRQAVIVHDDSISYPFKSIDRSRLTDLHQQSGTDEIIIIKKGLVTDGFATNLVFESEEGLFTPSDYLLPGTKRQSLIDLEVITERQISEKDIRRYSRVYFINAMIDLEDNISIETKSLI